MYLTKVNKTQVELSLPEEVRQQTFINCYKTPFHSGICFELFI